MGEAFLQGPAAVSEGMRAAQVPAHPPQARSYTCLGPGKTHPAHQLPRAAAPDPAQRPSPRPFPPQSTTPHAPKANARCRAPQGPRPTFSSECQQHAAAAAAAAAPAALPAPPKVSRACSLPRCTTWASRDAWDWRAPALRAPWTARQLQRPAWTGDLGAAQWEGGGRGIPSRPSSHE